MLANAPVVVTLSGPQVLLAVVDQTRGTCRAPPERRPKGWCRAVEVGQGKLLGKGKALPHCGGKRHNSCCSNVLWTVFVSEG